MADLAAPSTASRTERVLAGLRAAADASGWLPFDRFLEIALYAPAVGYYTRPDVALGRTGDFYTAAHVGPILARVLARRVRSDRDRFAPGGAWTVVELGPGDGRLAAGLVKALPAGDGPVRYILVDRSPSLRAQAEARLAAARRDAPGFTIETAASIAEVGPLSATVLANELLDALPFRRAVRVADGWRELGVATAGPTLAWAPGPPIAPPEGAPGFPDAEEGDVLDLPDGAQALLREVADHLRRGSAIFLDYGDEEPQVVRPGPVGTLSAIRGHTVLAEPLHDPGTADLSAFVNFTRVRAAARRSGLAETAYGSMAQVLADWGLADVLAEAKRAARSPEEEVRVALAGKNLAFGFSTFKVLAVGAG